MKQVESCELKQEAFFKESNGYVKTIQKDIRNKQ